MSEQGNLFAGAPSMLAEERRRPSAPYQSHSETSKAAAKAIEPHLNSLQQKVFAYLQGVGGATDEQGITTLAMSASTYRPRRIELCRLGLVRASVRTTTLKSGRAGIVWEAVEK